MDESFKGIAKVTKKLANGTIKAYWYAWRGGPQLQGEPGSNAFAESFAEAKRDRDTPAPVSTVPMLDGLIERFRRSDEFKSKAQSTKREYDRYLKLIENDFGTMPIEALAEKAVRGVFKDWRDGMSGTPRAADYAWSVLARLMSFAEDRGIISWNPCQRGGKLYSADRNEIVWTEDHLTQLFASASPEIAAVVTFALWTGQRQADCLAAPWTNLEDGRIKVVQEKGGRPILVPMGVPLADIVATLPRTKAGTILTNSRGEAWTSSGFRASLRKAMARAGIDDDLHFHDLRGTAVTRMALAGCTSLQIAAVTGHSPRHVDAILEKHYLGGQGELAQQAIDRLDVHRLQTGSQTRKTTTSVPPGFKPW